MTRITTMALAAGILTLATGPVAMGEMVEFKYDWGGNAPIGGPEVESWSMSHVSEVVYYEEQGDWGFLPNQELVVNMTVGDQEIPVVAGDWIPLQFFAPSYFTLGMGLNDVPGYGPLRIDMVLESDRTGKLPWSGTAAIVWGPGTPFGDGVSQTGTWSAQIIPGPGAIALFGLAGLSGRRRRD
ncbi:MAG: hypothetical protein P8I74_09015 [Phycisphaerales bacterium]|nr:hypothetical protein [Phycisphaerales bacterium]